MIRIHSLLMLGAVLTCLCLLPHEAFAQRFGGGHRGGGFHGGGAARGGGYHGGGGFHGGVPMARPQQHGPVQRAPAQRPAMHGSAVHGPFGGGGVAHRPAAPATRPGAGGAGERHVWQGPHGGTVIGGGGHGGITGPGGNTISGGGGRWAYTGPHGGVVVHGGKGGEISGPGGRTIAGGKSGTAVIGPNGNIHTSGTKGVAVKGPGGKAIAGSHGGMTVGPGGASAHGSRGGIATGPGGTIAGGSRGGIATGPGGTIAGGSRGGIATGPGGTIAGGSRGAIAVGPHGAAAAGGRAIAGRGPGGGFVAGTHFVAASNLYGQGAFVRNNFRHWNAFTPNWYRRYPGAWFAAGWISGSAWTAATWPVYTNYLGYAADTSAIYYNYGDNVTYQDGNVYYDDQVYATEAGYAQEAMTIADKGQQTQPAPDEKWQALGVFAMTKGEETTSNDIFQLAINKDGVVRGNYYNALTDAVQPVIGSLDKQTQRIAWVIGDKKDTVYDTGLYNLTQAETTLLVHYGKDRTEQYHLFRVEQKEENKEQGK